MSRLLRLLRWLVGLALFGALLGIAAIGVAYWLIAPKLPTAAQIRDIKLQVPLKVYSADGKLMAIFGEALRTPVDIELIPKRLKQAFLAIEDARFYEHPGFDMVGISRAAWLLATTKDKRVPGGSTITQQVAKNFFLSSEYSVSRKLAEIFLAIRMERELTKDEIFELYLNKIFFGYRAYGVVAAADFYYGKPLNELTLAEVAMLAAVPKFPSSGNPLNNPSRALQRRDYVLLRMRDEGFINTGEYSAAVKTPDRASPHEPKLEMHAPYLAEMVRQEAIARLGGEALTAGYTVTITVTSQLQQAAELAVRAGLEEYDRRHGYRGAEAHIDLADDSGPDAWREIFEVHEAVAGQLPALVIAVDARSAQLVLADGSQQVLPFAGVAWARPYLKANARGAAPSAVTQVLKRGDIVRIQHGPDGAFRLAQIPAAQAALVALDPDDGAVRALVGGYHFRLSKFNRAVQSNRQPGSSFKPFIYSAALERGFSPASVVNDAPVEFPDPSRPNGVWRPQNSDGKFLGPMSLRQALMRSRNLVSVRLLDTIGVGYAREYVTRFGFPLASLPENLSLALGTASVAPLAMARGYAVFANGGYRVEPYVVARVLDADGKQVYVANPPRVCRDCQQRLADGDRPPGSGGDAQELSVLLGDAPPEDSKPESEVAVAQAGPALATRVIDARNAFMLTSMMRDVIKRGTGRGALVLKRDDLAGKTGTTNESRDGWFSGFNDRLVTTAWIGFDDFTPLGRGEYAASVALPIWVAFMRAALNDMPESPFEPPPGMTAVRVTGGAGVPTADGGVVEYFRNEDLNRLANAQSADTAARDSEQGYDLF